MVHWDKVGRGSKVHRKEGAGLLTEGRASPSQQRQLPCWQLSRLQSPHSVPEGFVQTHEAYHLAAGPHALWSSCQPLNQGFRNPAPQKAGFLCSSPLHLLFPLYPASQPLLKLLQNQEARPLLPSCSNSARLENPVFTAPTCGLFWPLGGSAQRTVISFIALQSSPPPHPTTDFHPVFLLSTEQDQGVFFLSKFWGGPTKMIPMWLRLPGG